MPKLLSRFAGIAALALALSFTTVPVQAATTSSLSDSSTTEYKDPEKLAVSAAEVGYLSGKGFDTTDVTKQINADGAAFYLNGEGEFYFSKEGEVGVQPGEVAALFDVGGCVGSFRPIVKFNNVLEWGAQNSCISLQPVGYAPHVVRVDLRNTCTGIFCAVQPVERQAFSQVFEEFNPVITVNREEPCITGTDRVYSQVVFLQVASNQYGPFASLDATVPCNINPD